MKKILALVCLSFAVSVSMPALAGPQQEKMKGCNAEASAQNLKGDARKAFMKKCLKKDYKLKSSKAVDGRAGQQEKMKTCNAEAKAKGLAGDERKKFMRSCLKK